MCGEGAQIVLAQNFDLYANIDRLSEKISFNVLNKFLFFTIHRIILMKSFLKHSCRNERTAENEKRELEIYNRLCYLHTVKEVHFYSKQSVEKLLQ